MLLQKNLVLLEPLKPKFTIIARAITGLPIDIYTAENEGGFKDQNFFLPSNISLFSTKEENNQFYLFRLLYLSVQQKLNLNWHDKIEKSELESRLKSKEMAPLVLVQLFAEFPQIKEVHDQYLNFFNEQKTIQFNNWHMLYGKFMRNEGIINEKNQKHLPPNKTKKIREEIIKTTLQAKAIEEMVVLDVDLKAQEDYVLNHNFEKVDTAEEFNGVWRDFDGEDELEQHQDALDELNMKYTVRIDDPVHSILQADFVENSKIAESASNSESGPCYFYSEWNYKKKVYKPNYCKVYPLKVIEPAVGFYQKTIAENKSILLEMRKMLANLTNQWKRTKRQNDGNEFDIDSLTDLYIDVHTGHTPSENIYIANRKAEKDLSILLLLDISLSSDGYVAGNKVLDIEKQVAILFGEILDEMKIDFSIQCFYSKTRNYSSYITVKGFDEPWNKGKFKIGSVEANGYTRIGAAIRHSGSLIMERPAEKKWMILLSDGKPNDFDQYEGKYGINDIKQSLRELHEEHVNTYALAIEANAKYYLPQMFGHNNYQILSSTKELISALVSLFTRIKFGN
ncbi:MAG: VWA domain-containing protein [bacterium]|nr:VWA domain-containing protein [bacterium]